MDKIKCMHTFARGTMATKETVGELRAALWDRVDHAQTKTSVCS